MPTLRHALAGLTALLAATARAEPPPDPIFVETFAGELDRWVISGGLDPTLRAERISAVPDALGHLVVRITVRTGDALSGATAAMRVAGRYVCDLDGSRALEMEAEPGGVAPSERVEMQIKHDRATGIGELVRFGEPVWYRFGFKVPQDWPRDRPLGVRPPCRTVIHQIKQDSFRNGESCSASPFFKIEARPLGDRLRFFAQVTAGAACAEPPVVTRTLICITDLLTRDAWHHVNVRLLPMQDARGEADVWLDGVQCGAYRGPMGDTEHGARRDGKPVINAQPRFGIYRDWRAEPQTIYLDRIMFWNSNPAGHEAWNLPATSR